MELYELRAYLEEKRAEQEVIEERYNKYHDPRNGRFTNGSGGGTGSVLVIPKGHAGVYRGHKAAMQKSMSAANEQAAQRIQALGGNVNGNGNYSFQEHGGLMMVQGQTNATPNTVINVNTGNVTQQATNTSNPLTNQSNNATISQKPSIENVSNGSCSAVIDKCRTSSVKHNPVKNLDRELTEKEIIDRVGGGDLTVGSCVSLAYAYAANRAGYDVLDFRGGRSLEVFAGSRSAMANAVKATQYESIIGENTTPGKKLKILKNLPEGEEYVFRTGSHAAVVRQVGGKVQYLELQSPTNNGWHDMTKASTMTKRFGGKAKHSGYSLVNVKELPKAEGFKELMGYINTDEHSQRKGAWGYEK